MVLELKEISRAGAEVHGQVRISLEEEWWVAEEEVVQRPSRKKTSRG
jgi:hypothetical protein